VVKDIHQTDVIREGTPFQSRSKLSDFDYSLPQQTSVLSRTD